MCGGLCDFGYALLRLLDNCFDLGPNKNLSNFMAYDHLGFFDQVDHTERWQWHRRLLEMRA